MYSSALFSGGNKYFRGDESVFFVDEPEQRFCRFEPLVFNGIDWLIVDMESMICKCVVYYAVNL